MDPKTNFKLIVIQTELERFKFLVRSFLRARLRKVRFLLSAALGINVLTGVSKIDQHPLHVRAQHDASLDTVRPLLSSPELQYLTSHQALLSQHYSASFLSQFPASLQRLDDTTGGISMVDKPDEDKAVFVRALRDIGTVFIEGTDRRLEVKRGDVWVVRWSAVRKWAVGSGTGDVELI